MVDTANETSKRATSLLLEIGSGDASAVDELVPIVYAELRRMAAGYLRRERRDHTLQPTALVHEVYLRLIDQKRVEWQNGAHFLAIAARTMRQVLVDHARGKGAIKRGGGRVRDSVELSVDGDESRTTDILALDEALERLDAHDPLKRKLVELRFFGGLTIEETAEALEISTGSVKRHWASAKARLFRDLFGDPGGE